MTEQGIRKPDAQNYTESGCLCEIAAQLAERNEIERERIVLLREANDNQRQGLKISQNMESAIETVMHQRGVEPKPHGARRACDCPDLADDLAQARKERDEARALTGRWINECERAERERDEANERAAAATVGGDTMKVATKIVDLAVQERDAALAEVARLKGVLRGLALPAEISNLRFIANRVEAAAKEGEE